VEVLILLSTALHEVRVESGTETASLSSSIESEVQVDSDFIVAFSSRSAYYYY
jgi:hypothetical protein